MLKLFFAFVFVFSFSSWAAGPDRACVIAGKHHEASTSSLISIKIKERKKRWGCSFEGLERGQKDCCQLEELPNGREMGTGYYYFEVKLGDVKDSLQVAKISLFSEGRQLTGASLFKKPDDWSNKEKVDCNECTVRECKFCWLSVNDHKKCYHFQVVTQGGDDKIRCKAKN